MQKLPVELKNVPRNAPQVPCSTSFGLNRDQSLSDQSVADRITTSMWIYLFMVEVQGQTRKIICCKNFYNFKELNLRSATPPSPEGEGILAQRG